MMSPFYLLESELDKITEKIRNEFSIQMDNIEKVTIPNQTSTTEYFLVKDVLLPPNSFIIHTPSSQLIGDDLSIIGSNFEFQNYATALEVGRLMRHQGLFSRPNTKFVTVYQLRASPLYGYGKALPQLLPDKDIREVFLRLKYVEKDSFRAHDGENLENENGTKSPVKVLFEDFTGLPKNSRIIPFFPDSVATYRTFREALRRFVEVATNPPYNDTIDSIAMAGWTSKPGAVRAQETVKELGLDLWLCAYENLTELNNNGYDMPIYGFDEGFFTDKGIKKKRGSVTIIPRSVFQKHLPSFPPGSDQLGDYSERGTVLHTTKTDTELPNTRKHLETSIRVAQTLYDISKGEPWFFPIHQKIFDRQLWLLNSRLKQLPAQEIVKSG